MLKLPVSFLFAVVLALVAACGEEEAGLQEPSPTSALPSPTTLDPDLGTIVPPPPALPTPVVIPPDWQTFLDQEIGDFTFQYPRGWFRGVSPGQLGSFDPSNSPSVDFFPATGIAVEVGRVSLQAPGIAPRPNGATDTTLDRAPGWEVVFTYGGVDVVQRIHTVHVDRNGYRYYILGYFGQPDADETIFLQILSTFKFVN
jgi:hypothetical protein